MQDPDPILVERLRNKDKRAFELVFREYFGMMKIYAMRYMDDREDAEEIVQDVFFKFWEKCETIAPDSSVKSYLYRAVHNSCLNSIKHQKVKDAYQKYMVQMMQTEQAADPWNEEVKDKAERIREAIEELSPRCAEIFKLSRYEGLKYQEIADHLEISIKTVEVQMGKALKSLRETLKDLKGT